MDATAKRAPLILASASPRRRELLERVGLELEVVPADVDETPRPGELPITYVTRVAADKAAAIASSAPARWVLAADTIVEVDGAILGKAADADEAVAMLRRLAGRGHRVTTAFSLRGPGAARDGCVTTEVVMRALGDRELSDYVAAGEWRGKAGAYAVQGMAAAFVVELRGSVTSVVGLPLCEVLAALAEVGAGRARFTEGDPA